MDLKLATWILGTLVGLLTLVIGAMWRMLMKQIDEIKQKDEAQDQRIGEIVETAHELETNYNAKFGEVKDVIHEVEKNILAAVASIRTNCAYYKHEDQG